MSLGLLTILAYSFSALVTALHQPLSRYHLWNRKSMSVMASLFTGTRQLKPQPSGWAYVATGNEAVRSQPMVRTYATIPW